MVNEIEFTDLLVGKEYPKNLYDSAKRYAEFRAGDNAKKEQMIIDSLVIGMRPEEQFQAMEFILENNHTQLLIDLKLLIERSDELTLYRPLDLFTRQLGYQLTGTSDNPVISFLE